MLPRSAVRDDQWTWIKQLEHSKRDADGNKQFHGASVADCYFASLHFTVYTITSVGYGDINPVNRTEMVVNTLFIVTGAIIWAYIIGNFASLLSTVDVYGAQFRQSMDELNVMMAERNFPVSLRKRCRTFFRQSRNMARVANYRKLEGMMSYALRGEAATDVPLKRADRVPLGHATLELVGTTAQDPVPSLGTVLGRLVPPATTELAEAMRGLEVGKE